MDSVDPLPVEVVPTWDSSSAQAAQDAAHSVMTHFTDTDLDAQAWYEALAPSLTATAQEVAYGTDPARIPAHLVRGVVVTPDTSAYLATAQVATDVGDYTLQLVRSDGGSPWQVEAITAPAGLGP